MVENPFLLDGVEVEYEDPSVVTICFVGKDGERRPVTFRRSNLPPLITLLKSKIEVGSVTPINSGSLVPGQRFAIEGIQPISKPDGSAQIVFWIRLPDDNNRGVTLPVDLSEDERLSLIKGLGGKT
jgi:hypothetical protein